MTTATRDPLWLATGPLHHLYHLTSKKARICLRCERSIPVGDGWWGTDPKAYCLPCHKQMTGAERLAPFARIRQSDGRLKWATVEEIDALVREKVPA